MKKVREEFRQEIQRVLKANYVFYVLRPKDEQQIEAWINRNFKDIHGKIFRPYEKENLFILALEKESAKEALRKRKPLDELSVDLSAVPTPNGKTLLELLESAFVIKPVDEHNSTLDNAIEQAAAVAQEEVVRVRIAAEDVADDELLPRYYLERYKDAEILVGVCKGDRYMDWILQNKLYNVRLDDKREGGFKRSELFKRQPKFVIIYNEETYVYRAFLSERGKTWSKEQMKAAGYPEAKSDQYYVSPLNEEVNIGDYNIKDFVSWYCTNNQLNANTPIFTKVEELLKHKK
jgi:hypothetical protein